MELKVDRPSYMVLRGTYGEKIHKTFGTTRQGVRWRFHHVFMQAYVEALGTILFIEKTFGPQLRDYAIRISKERFALRQEAISVNFQSGGLTGPKIAATLMAGAIKGVYGVWLGLPALTKSYGVYHGQILQIERLRFMQAGFGKLPDGSNRHSNGRISEELKNTKGVRFTDVILTP